MVGRSKTANVAVILDKETRRAFKIHCAKKGIEMSAWIRRQIERELKSGSSEIWGREPEPEEVKPIDEVNVQE
jgi:hypothetical protein